MREIIQNFLNSDRKSIPLQVKPLDEYVNIINESGFEKDDITTNGWSVDFQQEFHNDDQRICLSGSLFYGGYQLTKLENE